MKIRLAFLICLASLGLNGSLAAAEEKKAEHKAEAKKPEAKKEEKAEGKKEGKSEGKESKEAKHEAPHEAKAEAKHEPAPVHEEKPSPAPRPTLARRTPIRMPGRPTSRAARIAPAAVAAKPVAAPAPAPVVVQIKQEPARVEAILHVVPYGQGPGVPSFAGSGYGSSGPYTVAAYPMEPGQAQAEAAPAPVDPANNYAPVVVNTASAAPSYAAPAYPAPAGPPPIRNVLRAPKNALTNEGLVTLAQVGYDEDFILDLMRQKTCRFDTSVEGLAYMATHGLTERIVKAALKADAEMQTAQQLEARR